MAIESQDELVREGWSREAQRLTRRRLLTELVVGGAFLVVAVAMAVLIEADRDFEALPAALLTACFALGIRVNIDVGAGYTSPVQLAFVPMLLLLPTPLVPLLVALGWLAGRLPDFRDPSLSRDRLLLIPANCWFAVGPAAVLCAFDAQLPDWDDWPVYLLALASQFALDLGAGTLREWLGEGIAPEMQLKVFALVSGIDALLSPLGLLAAFASESFEYAFLLLVPPAALLSFYAHERGQRIEGALALADAARERQELIAGASHQLVTPVGVLYGLTSRLAPGRPLDDARREALHGAMHREIVQLRQLVRQFVDYTRLRTERELALDLVPVDVAAVAGEVATALSAAGTIELDLPADLPPAHAAAERLHQMLMSMAAWAMRDTAPAWARVEARSHGDELVITVTGGSDVEPDPVGLQVTEELARAHGGRLESRSVLRLVASRSTTPAP